MGIPWIGISWLGGSKDGIPPHTLFMKLPEFGIDTDDLIPESGSFTWGEALYLPHWNRFANSSDGLDGKIITSIQYFAKNFLKPIRDFMGAPFIVHCWYRPPQYSVLVGGTSTDVHTGTNSFDENYVACAIDFHPIFSENVVKSCQTFKAKIAPYLAKFNVRMEDTGVHGGWIHIDNLPPRAPLHHRFFKAA